MLLSILKLSHKVNLHRERFLQERIYPFIPFLRKATVTSSYIRWAKSWPTCWFSLFRSDLLLIVLFAILSLKISLYHYRNSKFLVYSEASNYSSKPEMKPHISEQAFFNKVPRWFEGQKRIFQQMSLIKLENHIKKWNKSLSYLYLSSPRWMKF